MNPKLFDVHTHTHFAAYENDSREVIDRALKDNIWIVNVGTQRDTSLVAVQVANEYPEGVYATVGLHPIHTEASYHDKKELGGSGAEFTSRGEVFDFEMYKKLAEDKKTVAIGECGLDYYRLNDETKKKQADVFVSHMELAHAVSKPLMIHCRQAFGDLIQLLTDNKQLLATAPGIIHFMSGTKDDAKKLLEFGFSFSFGGVTTFTRDYDDVIKYIPMEHLLLETDAPYVAPTPYRGKRNEPAYIKETAEKLAEIKGVSFEDMAGVTTKNALKIFNLN